jgi:CRISPR/Cas system-associated exonuclease Cas4 (RecB family)
MVGRPHWSYSALSQYLSCPLRFYFQRVLGLPQPTVPAHLVLGSSVHQALAEYHRAVQRQRPALTGRLHEAFRGAWARKEAEATVTYRVGESRDEEIDLGIALIETYIREPPPEHVVAVEREIIAPIHTSRGEYLEKPLVAVADLITRPAGGLAVLEYKTSGRAYSRSEADTSLQATCYASVGQEAYGVLPALEYVVLVKTRTPKVQRVTTRRAEGDFGRLGDLIQAVDRAVDAGIFYPVETPLNCSGCPYRGPCRDWGSASPPPKGTARIPLLTVPGGPPPSAG